MRASRVAEARQNVVGSPHREVIRLFPEVAEMEAGLSRPVSGRRSSAYSTR